MEGILRDGTPYSAGWRRKCLKCGTWVMPDTIAHGLLGDLCKERETKGRRRLDMGVASELRPRNGTRRWNTFRLVKPTKEQMKEIRGLIINRRDI